MKKKGNNNTILPVIRYFHRLEHVASPQFYTSNLLKKDLYSNVELSH